MAKISLQTIADAVGVSKYAVSRALAGKSGVKPGTRDKIIEAATRLGYFAQQKTARPKEDEAVAPVQSKRLAKKAIAVVLPNVEAQTKQNPYWGKVLQGIASGIEQWDGLNMVIVTEQFSHNLSSVLNTQALLGYIGVGNVPAPLLLEIKQSGLPFVFVDFEAPLLPADAIFMNNFDCVRRLTNYLIGIGHRSFQFVGNASRHRSYYDRWRGFASALDDDGIPHKQDGGLLHVVDDHPDQIDSQIAERLASLAASGALPTAFVCANDQFAASVVAALRSLGLSVPDDCSVTGFDDLSESSADLTTVRSAKEAIGKRAVEMLIRRVDRPDESRETILLSGDLLIRRSTAAPEPLRSQRGPVRI